MGIFNNKLNCNELFYRHRILRGPQKKLFGYTKPTIDLISIGVVCEDGREYYAISKDFNLKEAWNRYDLKKSDYHPNGMESREDIKVYWIRENVLKPIWEDFVKSAMKDIRINGKNCSNDSLKESDMNFTYNNLKYLVKKYGKSNKQIAEEIYEFCTVNEKSGNGVLDQVVGFKDTINRDIKFYSYYSDYDWVCFCWLFGKMIDLPKGFPMYCIDLKQVLDEKADTIDPHVFNIGYKSEFKPGFLNKLDWIKNHPLYPKQTNEHNALSDARWNHELYKFLLNV